MSDFQRAGWLTETAPEVGAVAWTGPIFILHETEVQVNRERRGILAAVPKRE